MIVVCCVCQRVRQGEAWVEETVPAGTLPSHGYCPDCAAAARVELALMRLKHLQEASVTRHSAVA